jgi:cell division protein FtsL
MLNSDKNELDSINLLENKVQELLDVFKDLRQENSEYKNQVKTGNSARVILDSAKRRQLRKKIENMLEYLEDF